MEHLNERAVVFIQLHIHVLCTACCPLVSIVMAALHERMYP